VFSWFDGRAKRVEIIPRLTARGERPSTTKVDIRDLTPGLLPFLGQAAYFELGVFESLARAVAIAPTLAAKEGLSTAAGRALSKHQGLVAEIRRRGGEPAEEMAPFMAALDRFRAQTSGVDWIELLLSCYLAGGLLDDFFIRLSDGLPGDVGPRVAHLLGEDAGTAILAAQLTAAIDAHPPLASHLALWGRRLVGDTLLIARSALALAGPPAEAAGAAETVASVPVGAAPVESRIEPVFTELIAAHTRRMDGLGLTA
jgi:hypothetical protein